MSRYRNIHCLIWNDDKFQELWRKKWDHPEIIPPSYPITPRGCNHYYSECDCKFSKEDMEIFKRQQQVFVIRRQFNHIRKKIKQDILKKFGGICICCGEDDADQLTIDHVIPVVYGGTNDICNFSLLCRSCNSKKGMNLPEAPDA